MKNSEQNDYIRHTLKQAMPDDLPAAVAERMQNRLTAFRDRLDAESARPRNRITHWIGGFTVRQRIAALGSFGVAAALVFFLLWVGIDTKPVSAMEKMAENIRKAKSYKYNMIVRITYESPEPGRPRVSEYEHVIYRLASGEARTEDIRKPGWKGPGPESTEICLLNKPGIYIDWQQKTFRRLPARQTASYSGRLDDLENLGRFSGDADRELGTKEINGKKARGFHIDMKKMGGDSGFMEIWLDTESDLPVLICTQHTKFPGHTFDDVYKDIQWNIDFDPKLFDATPPEGYTDVTPKPPTLEEQQRQIIDSLRTYANASGGHYPPHTSPDNFDDLCKMLGLVKWPSQHEAEGNAGKAARAEKGLDQMGNLKVYNADFAYHGKTVKPSDKDKVLLRWKLDDGRYEVIFGDLRAETVTAQRLRALEGK